MSTELDIYLYKQKRLKECVAGVKGAKKAGLITGLEMNEYLPLWAGFFESLGFEVILSNSPETDFCTPNTALSKICRPAKLVHARIESLLNTGVDFIFMPCESFDIDEHFAINNLNCPILAYYPEIMRVSCNKLTAENFLTPYINLNAQKSTVQKLYQILKKFGVKKGAVKRALFEGMKRLEGYRLDLRAKTDEILKTARAVNKRIILLAGRPCYLDSLINHGINKLLTSMDFAVISEDGIPEDGQDGNSFSQWVYRARLCRAAEYAQESDISFLQLITKCCKPDEITAGEVRAIMEKSGKLYVQINPDEKKKNLKSMLTGLSESIKRGD